MGEAESSRSDLFNKHISCFVRKRPYFAARRLWRRRLRFGAVFPPAIGLSPASRSPGEWREA
jgi:hypothetical protein